MPNAAQILPLLQTELNSYHDFNARGWWLLALIPEHVSWFPGFVASIEAARMTPVTGALYTEGQLILVLGSVALSLVCGVVKGTDAANRFGEKPTWGGIER